MTSPLQTVLATIGAHVTGQSLWGDRVQAVAMATSTLAKPCLLFFVAGGGRELVTPTRRNVRFSLSVKSVAESMQQAVTMQEAISGLLADAGSQDVSPRLPVQTGWEITTITEGRMIWTEELIDNTRRVYHAGYVYDITMEAI